MTGKDKDFVIFDSAWGNVKGDPSAPARYRLLAETLVGFLRESLLLAGEPPSDDSGMRLRKSDVTEDGFLFLKKEFQSWLRSVDRGGRPDDKALLRKRLARFRASTIS
jgi:hypothetical protein